MDHQSLPKRKTRKWWLPLTYKPKIDLVLSGACSQTIRPGNKFLPGDQIAFHGWSGVSRRSPWSFRTPYLTIIHVEGLWVARTFFQFQADVSPTGIIDYGAVNDWKRAKGIARRDGLDPPTGEALCKLFHSMYPIPETGAPFQIIRWDPAPLHTGESSLATALE